MTFSDFWPSALSALLEAGWDGSGNGNSLIVERFVILAHLFFSENYTNQLSSSYKFPEKGNVLVFCFGDFHCNLCLHGNQRELMDF